MTKLTRKLICFIAACLLIPSLAHSGGFHYKVSTSSLFYADTAGNLAGVRMNWVYDPEISATILDGWDTSEAGMKKLGENMLADLYEAGYFTQFMMNDYPLPIDKIDQYSIKLTESGSIQLGLQLALQQAVDVAGKEITLTLSDPDGTADMVYTGADRVALDEFLAAKCIKPELVSMPVDVNDHQLTIQTVVMRCQ